MIHACDCCEKQFQVEALRLHFTGDVLCPGCWNAQERLDRAIEASKGQAIRIPETCPGPSAGDTPQEEPIQ